jgi:hypothetical protein
MNHDPITIETILVTVDYRPRLPSGRGSRHEVLAIIDGVAVCKCIHNAPFSDAIYTAAILKGNTWRNTCVYEDSASAAFLEGLKQMRLGPNSDFTFLAKRMLGLNQDKP